MYAGELIFILIACMTLGGSFASGLTWAMAPMRAKWVPMTVNPALRYFTASSGFWN